jgi:hypothetical protein
MMRALLVFALKTVRKVGCYIAHSAKETVELAFSKIR